MALQLLYLTLLVQGALAQVPALKFSFGAPEYVLIEGVVTNNMVMLNRDDSSSITPASVAIDTTCPTDPAADCAIPFSSNEAEKGTDKDYTLNGDSFQFGQSDVGKRVLITVYEDGNEEHKEYFCLRIVDPEQRGTRWFTRVIIPWNDHCVKQFSIFDEGRDKDALGYFIKHDISSVVSHIGPWDVTLASEIKIKVTPQPASDQINMRGGDGNDLNIFVSNRADINAFGTTDAFQWKGLHLDDSFGPDHAPGVLTGNSWIDNSALTREPFTPGVLLGTALTTEMVTQGQNEFTLTLDPTANSISLQKDGGATLEATGGSITGLNNLFVTSANDKYASWEICGLEPRRLPIVGATASGHYQNFEPDLAIDNLIWYTSCFRSESDGSNTNWLALDMGAEFLVKKVVMYPAHFGEDLPLKIMDPRWLNNLGVRVGSCRANIPFTNNNLCNADIGIVASDPSTNPDKANAAQKLIIDIDCVPNAIGRYVYITPQSASTHIGFCEVRLFGSEVPASSETKVVIALTAQADEGSPASVTVTQTGSKPTCSYIQYHTDRAPNNDFDEAYPSKEVMIRPGGNTAITIPTNDDEDCEGDETFDVYVTGIEGGVLTAGSSCRSTVTIKDDVNDRISFTLTTPEPSVAENVGMVTFTVGHSGVQAQPASACVTFTGGSAALVQDYSTAVSQDVTFETLPDTVSVDIVDDNCYEESETFEVTLADLKPTCSMAPSNIPLTITLTDNDSQFDFSVEGLTDKVLTITEGTSMMLNVQRMGTVQMKTVNYEVTLGSASESDVTITPSSPNTLSFEANVATAAITIVAEEDGDAEADEVFQLTLVDPNGEGCLNNIGANKYVIVRVVDNDFMYEFETPSSTNIAEGEQTEICLRRICSTSTPCPTNIPAATVAIAGQPITATANDYSIPSAISIPQGMNRGCVNIQIVSDTTQETAELFNVIIVSGQAGVEGSDSLTFTVFETAGSLRFSPLDYTVREGVSQVSVTVVHTSTANVQFRLFTKDGSAIAGTDYTAVDQTFTLAANTPNMNIPISILNDGNPESSEQFTACIESSSLQVMDAARATITIDDNDVITPPPRRPIVIIAFVIRGFRGRPLVFTPDLRNPFSPAFLDLSFVIINLCVPFYRVRLRGFFRLRVIRFRPGSVIADLEVELESNTPTTGAEVISVTRETPPEEILTIDFTTLELLAEVCPTGYCNNGTCAANADNDGSVCTCNPNYSGDRCDTRGAGGGGSYTTIIIVVNVVLWSIVAVMIGACYYLQMRKQKEEKLNEAPAQPIYPNQYNSRGLSSFSPSGDTSWALAPL